MKEDGAEIGRTQTSTVVPRTPDAAMTPTPSAGPEATETVTGTVSWQHNDAQFSVTSSPHRGGFLPLEFVVELWETGEGENTGSSSDAAKKKITTQSCYRLVGTVTVDPDTLLLSSPGRLTLPLSVNAESANPKKTLAGSSVAFSGTTGKASARDAEAKLQPLEMILRITPQVGLHWGRRAILAAEAARRVALAPPSPNAAKKATGGPSPAVEGTNGDNSTASVLFMTNADGSVRTWRAPVTPGNSISRKAYGDVLELTYASLPACCPQAPALVVAPLSDIGVRLGDAWIGPQIAARHAIVAFRPARSVLFAGADSGGENAEGATVEPPQEDEVFMRTVAAEAEVLLRGIRANDMRVEQRRLALIRVHEVCQTWSRTHIEAATTQMEGEEEQDEQTEDICGRGRGMGQAHQLRISDEVDGRETRLPEDQDDDDDRASERAYGDLFRGFLRVLEMALPGVAVYVGLLASGGQTIRYVACTRTSSMAGKELNRGDGVSFSCVGPRYAPSVTYHPRRSTASRNERPTDERHEKDAPETFAAGAVAEEDDRCAAPKRNIDPTHAAVTAGKKTSARTARIEPFTDLSTDESAALVQKAYREKVHRDQQARAEEKTPSTSAPGSPPLRNKRKGLVTTRKALPIPKMFDFEGRVGWPFVCVPLEGFLGASSIGVVGMDTFEQMGSNERGSQQPEDGVVKMVAEAAR